jgi:hypothetical protein
MSKIADAIWYLCGDLVLQMFNHFVIQLSFDCDHFSHIFWLKLHLKLWRFCDVLLQISTFLSLGFGAQNKMDIRKPPASICINDWRFFFVNLFEKIPFFLFSVVTVFYWPGATEYFKILLLNLLLHWIFLFFFRNKYHHYILFKISMKLLNSEIKLYFFWWIDSMHLRNDISAFFHLTFS